MFCFHISEARKQEPRTGLYGVGLRGLSECVASSLIPDPASWALEHITWQYGPLSQEAVRCPHTFTPMYKTEIRPLGEVHFERREGIRYSQS